MEIKARLNNLRIAPRKSRQVVDLIRKKNVADAKDLLEFTVKRASGPILKLLNSAVASANKNFKLSESNLFISKITVDEGPKLKRSFPMSRGRAYPIMKRTSHISLTLSEIKPVVSEKLVIKDTKEIKKEKPPKVKKTIKDAKEKNR